MTDSVEIRSKKAAVTVGSKNLHSAHKGRRRHRQSRQGGWEASKGQSSANLSPPNALMQASY